MADDFIRQLQQEAADKWNEFPGCSKLLTEAANRLQRQAALLGAVMDVEKAEPDGDPYDPASWRASVAKSVVAGSEFERVREAMWQAQDACRYYDEDMEVAKEHFYTIRDWLGENKLEAIDNLADSAARSIEQRLASIRALYDVRPLKEDDEQDSKT